MDLVLIHWMNYLTQGWHHISSHPIWSQSTKSVRDLSHNFQQCGCFYTTKRGYEGHYVYPHLQNELVSTVLYGYIC